MRVGLGGEIPAGTGPVLGEPGERLFGSALAALQGTRPRRAARTPPYRTDQPCHRRQLPDLNGPAAALGPPSPRALPGRD